MTERETLLVSYLKEALDDWDHDVFRPMNHYKLIVKDAIKLIEKQDKELNDLKVKYEMS